MTVPDPVTDVWELLWTAACDYRDANPQGRSEAGLIDALMPIVRKYAAEELRATADAVLAAAADWDEENRVAAVEAGRIVRVRADEIAAKESA